MFPDIMKILQKPPALSDLINMLADHCDKWYRIGISLNVRGATLNGLKQQTIDDIEKLHIILQSWMDTGSSPVTWETILDLLESRIVDLPTCAATIKLTLSQTKYYSKYIRQPDFINN